MIIALGRDREAEYKENLHKIANVSIARAVNKGWDQTKAYDIIWCQLIFCSAFMPDSGHSYYDKDTTKQTKFVCFVVKMIGELSTTILLICYHLSGLNIVTCGGRQCDQLLLSGDQFSHLVTNLAPKIGDSSLGKRTLMIIRYPSEN